VDTVALSRALLEETQGQTNGLGSGKSDLIRLSRDYLQEARARLLDLHCAGAGGMEGASAYTGMMD